MVRLDVLVAGILADARQRMDEGKTGGGVSKAAPGKGARGEEVARGKSLGCGGLQGAPALRHRGGNTRDTRRPSGGLGK